MAHYVTGSMTYETIAEFPMDPPMAVRGTVYMDQIGDGVVVIGAEGKVSVYQRDGDAYVCRGAVDLK